MANVINRKTKQYLKSVNTPDYPESEWIINPIIPNCNKKYLVIKGDLVKEMTQEEKAVVDYVPPPQEPTEEEIALRAEQKRESDIQNEIRKSYPTVTDELNIVRVALAELLPKNETIQLWNDVVIAAIEKYTEQEYTTPVIEEENQSLMSKIYNAIKSKIT